MCHSGEAVKKHEFERRVLDLWMTTRIPMTKAALQYHSGASRRRMTHWLDELVVDGVLDLDSDDAGELVYSVPGADRPRRGPTTFAEAQKLAQLSAEVGSRGARGARTSPRQPRRATGERPLARLRDSVNQQQALVVASAARRELQGKRPTGDKSVLLSGGLSFFLGPLGWLYAGAWREALPASAVYLVVMALIPTFLLLPVLPLAMGLSGVAGLVYALHYNRSGQRTPILGPETDESR